MKERKLVTNMRISVTLSKDYKVLEEIKQCNYPFRLKFDMFLETLCTIGLENKMNVFELVGYVECLDLNCKQIQRKSKTNIEDKQKYQFKYYTQSNIVQSYYERQSVSNKNTTLCFTQCLMDFYELGYTNIFQLVNSIKTAHEKKRKEQGVVSSEDTKSFLRGMVDKLQEELEIEIKKCVGELSNDFDAKMERLRNEFASKEQKEHDEIDISSFKEGWDKLDNLKNNPYVRQKSRKNEEVVAPVVEQVQEVVQEDIQEDIQEEIQEIVQDDDNAQIEVSPYLGDFL